MKIDILRSASRLRTLSMFGVIASVVLLLASSNNPPNGSTGAPGEGLCSSCHSGNNPINGIISLSGLPSQIVPGSSYDLIVTLTRIAGTPVRGGFQLVALDGNNSNIGSFSQAGSNVAFETGGGRTYAEHRPFKLFGGNEEVSFDFRWTAPSVIPGNQVTIFFSGLLANGNGSSSGDRGVNANFTATVQAAGNDPEVNLTDIQNISCPGGSDGRVTAQASQGVPPYVFQWSNGAQTPSINNLSAGTYSVTVTDANNATTSASVTLTQPTSIQLSLVSSGSVTCANPEVTLQANASGGTPPYQFIWSNGASGSTTQVQSGGAYAVTLTDANSCSAIQQITVSEDTQSPVISAGPNRQILCFGGSVNLNGSGPTGGGFQIEWSTFNGTIISGANTYTPLVGAAGLYTLTVVNLANGCLAQSSVNVTGISSPLAIQLSTQNLTCFESSDGAVISSVTGGTPPYTYLWSNGQTNSNLTNASAGAYSLTVSDANQCTAIVQSQITQPPQILITLFSTGETGPGSNDGSASASASGGSGTLSYVWSNGATTQQINNLSPGTYRVTVSDENGCSNEGPVLVSAYSCDLIAEIVDTVNLLCFGTANGIAEVTANNAFGRLTASWSNGDEGLRLDDLTAGVYTVTITDEANCSASLEIEITQPDAIEWSLSVTQLSADGANDGVALIVANGGTGLLSFLWSNGMQGSEITGLAPGFYSVTISDENDCFVSEAFRIFPLNCQLEASLELIAPVSCHGESDAILQVFSDSPDAPVNILWEDGNTSTFRENLSSGNYRVIVVDAKTCEVELELFVAEPDPLELNIVDFTPLISVEGIGRISVLTLGGTQPYSYNWSLDGNFFSVDSQLDNLESGVYTLVITDANGCSLSESFEIALSTSSIETQQAGRAIWSAFPNPVFEELILSNTINQGMTVNVRVFNLHGKSILFKSEVVEAGDVLRLNLNLLLPGIYLLYIEDEFSRSVLKIQKN